MLVWVAPGDRTPNPARLRDLSEGDAPVGIAVAHLSHWGPGTTCR
jgi:hypothetical protein